MLRTSEFLPLIKPHAPGVPNFVAEHCVRLAAIEFCERTRGWRQIATMPTTDAGIAPAITPFAYAAIHEIEWAYFDGEKLSPIQFSHIDHGEDPQAGQVPNYITQSAPDTLMVYPAAAGTLKVSLFLKPRNGHSFGSDADNPLYDEFNQVPDHLFTQHGENIAFGALSRILAIPGESFTNPQGSMAFGAAFDDYCNRQFSMNMRGQHRAPRRTIYSDF